MSATVTGETCSKCRSRLEGEATKTFLGFRKIDCARCGTTNTLPLGDGTRIVYFVIVAVMIGLMVSASGSGQTPTPGFVAVCAAIALVRDFLLRQRA